MHAPFLSFFNVCVRLQSFTPRNTCISIAGNVCPPLCRCLSGHFVTSLPRRSLGAPCIRLYKTPSLASELFYVSSPWGNMPQQPSLVFNNYLVNTEMMQTFYEALVASRTKCINIQQMDFVWLQEKRATVFRNTINWLNFVAEILKHYSDELCIL
jgi:hypothetical protein